MSVLSERTGLGPLETAVLLTLDDAWARHDRPHAKCAKMMTLVSDRFGSGSNYAYEVLCDLARPWLVGLSLVDFHGNFGSPDFPPARPAFTECRLTPVGGLAVAAERGEGSPLPLGLINGTVYQGGTRPPFNPIGVVRSVLTALDEPSASDAHLAGIAGPPCFPGGCQLDGEVDRVLAGEPGVLVLRAQLAVTEIAGRKAIDITKLPPIVGTVMLRESLIARIEGEPICIDDWPSLDDDGRGLPLVDVADLTVGSPWGDGLLLRCFLDEGADTEECLDRLRREPGVLIEVSAQIPGGLGAAIRTWAEDHRSEAPENGLRRVATMLSTR